MERRRSNDTVAIRPRKTTDRGGWLCMPLADNVPNGKKGWRKIHCPICVGRDQRMKLSFSTTDWMELHAHGAL